MEYISAIRRVKGKTIDITYLKDGQSLISGYLQITYKDGEIALKNLSIKRVFLADHKGVCEHSSNDFTPLNFVINRKKMGIGDEEIHLKSNRLNIIENGYKEIWLI